MRCPMLLCFDTWRETRKKPAFSSAEIKWKKDVDLHMEAWLLGTVHFLGIRGVQSASSSAVFGRSVRQKKCSSAVTCWSNGAPLFLKVNGVYQRETASGERWSTMSSICPFVWWAVHWLIESSAVWILSSILKILPEKNCLIVCLKSGLASSLVHTALAVSRSPSGKDSNLFMSANDDSFMARSWMSDKFRATLISFNVSPPLHLYHQRTCRKLYGEISRLSVNPSLSDMFWNNTVPNIRALQ